MEGCEHVVLPAIRRDAACDGRSQTMQDLGQATSDCPDNRGDARAGSRWSSERLATGRGEPTWHASPSTPSRAVTGGLGCRTAASECCDRCDAGFRRGGLDAECAERLRREGDAREVSKCMDVWVDAIDHLLDPARTKNDGGAAPERGRPMSSTDLPLIPLGRKAAALRWKRSRARVADRRAPRAQTSPLLAERLRSKCVTQVVRSDTGARRARTCLLLHGCRTAVR